MIHHRLHLLSWLDMHDKRQILQRFTPVAFFSLLGSLAGILVETSIAFKLGLSEDSDTFYVAYTLPYILSNLIYSTGQFSLVPFFSTLRVQEGEEKLWAGLHSVANLAFWAMSGVALMGALATPLIVRVIAPGISRYQAEVATQMCVWLFLIIVPAGVVEVLRSFLFSQQRFAVASAAGLFRNVTVIASIWITFRSYGVFSIVLGYLLGYLVQLIALSIQLIASFRVQVPKVRRSGSEAFRHLRGATGAQLASALTWQGLVLVERMIASFLPPGSLTALNYGFKIFTTLSELVAGSLGTAVLPSLVSAVARKTPQEEERTYRHALELNLMALFPLTLLCLLLDQQIIRFVFERGNFTRQATELMAQVFFWYSLSLIFHSFLRSLNFYFFARGQSWLFYRLFFLQCSLAAGFYFLFLALGQEIKSIPLGLLSALTVTVLVVFIGNLGGMRYVLDRESARLGLRILGGGLLGGVTVVTLQSLLQPPVTGFSNFLHLTLLCGVGTGVFALMLGLTKSVLRLPGKVEDSVDL